MSRTLVIGDVHGCLDELKDLLRLVSFRKGHDNLVQVGDLMDKGPDAPGCVRFMRELEATVLMGNHEEKHLRWHKHEVTRAQTGKKNPIPRFSEDKARDNRALSDEDFEWMGSLPLFHTLDNGMVIVHAGLEPAYTLEQQSKAVLRVRFVGPNGKMVGFSEGSLEQPEGTEFWAADWQGPESVVYGHTVHSLSDVRVDKFPGGACFGLDTGCVYGGRLTAMVVADNNEPEFAWVDARAAYCEREDHVSPDH